MADYGAMLGALAGNSASSPDDNTTIHLTPELYDAYTKATQGDVNPIDAKNGLPEGNATGIDPSIAAQDLASSQAPNQTLPPSSHGVFNALQPGYTPSDNSYSSDFLNQLINPTSQQPQQNAAALGTELGGIASQANSSASPTSDSSSISTVEPKTKSPINIDFGKGEIGTVENLKKAQNEADSNRKQANLFAGIDLIVAGLNHASPVAQQMYAQQLKDANIPIQKLEDQVAMEKQDPNSAMSKGFRDYLKTFNLNVQGDFSAADAEKLMPNVLKAYEADANRQAQKENLGYKYDELKTIAGIKAGEKSDAQSKKDEAGQDKAYSELRNKLETFRGNQAAQQASKDVLSADKALKLVQLKDPNTLTTQDLRLLADEMSKIATGGVPSEHGTTSLLPDSYRQKIAEIQNFLSNKPTDAQAGEYIKHNMKYLQDMKETAQGTLNNFRSNIIKGYKNRVKPEDYREAQSDYGLNNQDNTNAGSQSVPQSSTQSTSLGGYAQQMGIKPPIQAPPSPQDLNNQINQAKAHGYSDKEIQDYLAQKHGQ